MLQKTMKLFVLLVLPIVFAVSVRAQHSLTAISNKLDVTILYESLCPDSIRFMSQQLAPSYGKLKENLNINLVPFGKSQSNNNGAEFYCQHGPAECSGNRLTSCVLNQESTQDQRVRFAICQMKTNDKQNVNECTDETGLSNDIGDCVHSTLGTRLQLIAEQVTKHYSPSFVPTIVYDGVFNQQLQDRSLKNFLGTVCGLLQTRGIDNEACQ